MEGGRKKSTTRTTNGVVAGSVWESRMKVDEVKGGIKVFNGEENPEENGEKITSNVVTQLQVYKNFRPKQSLFGLNGKRKTLKSDNCEGLEKSPIQISRKRSEISKNLDEQCKELSVSADGIIKKNPIHIKRTRSEVGNNKELNVSVDGAVKSPIQTTKTRSLSLKGCSESSDGLERNAIQLRKVKSESNKSLDDGIEGNSELRKVKSEGSKDLVECGKNTNGLGDEIDRNSIELKDAKFEENKAIGSDEAIEKSPVGMSKYISDENCEEKVITSNWGHESQIKSPPQLVGADDHDESDEEDWDEELEEEIEEVEKKLEEEIEEVEMKSLQFKQIVIAEQTPKKILIEDEKFHQSKEEKQVPISPIVKKQPSPLVNSRQRSEKSVPISPLVKKQSPSLVNNLQSHPNQTKDVPKEIHRTSKPHSKLQSVVDLVMWREVSRSAFVFGIGTFIIISSSYTKDLNISLISVISYLGLVYLAAIFFFRSIIFRGAVDIEDTNQDYVVGEEEALWLLKLVLPYLNEFLIKLRAFFSGDPATTMKLAVLLFVLARCGSSITIWKMVKLGFFGVFTIPKVCSAYSTQLTSYGTFWVNRFRDAWDSCSHKKAVACGIFTLVWNLSSIIARFWAVFMLLVAFRYYQQSSLMSEVFKEEEEEATAGEDSWQPKIGESRPRRVPTFVDIKKHKKRL